MMAPSLRRRILPSETLTAFGAVPLYPSSSSTSAGNDDCTLRVVSSTTESGRLPTSSMIRVGASKADDTLIPNGILIDGWKVRTQNSSIGDEQRMEELTLLLEDTANNNASNMSNHLVVEEVGEDCTKGKRRLCPPEITFLDAIVSFQYQKSSSLNGSIDEDENNGEVMNEIRFSAQDALAEWAEAHTQLKQRQDDGTHSSAIQTRDEFRGVSIIRTADAKIWSNKQRSQQCAASATATSNNSQFYYDWTFSSPYAGTLITNTSHNNKKSNNISTDEKTEECDINNRKRWQPLQQSQIPFHLLQDTTQPILLYDDIHLYEDDLHDNGDVSLNIKVRVMPKCWYVLQRLYVRVDYVCVKCREVRYFCLFEKAASSGVANNIGEDVKVNTIYRDVTWKEATWEELGKRTLPMDPAAWRESYENAAGFASLLTRLPTVSLPEDMHRYSYFDAAISRE